MYYRSWCGAVVMYEGVGGALRQQLLSCLAPEGRLLQVRVSCVLADAVRMWCTRVWADLQSCFTPDGRLLQEHGARL